MYEPLGLLRRVYNTTDGVDGRVWIEVDPCLEHETEPTVAEANL